MFNGILLSLGQLHIDKDNLRAPRLPAYLLEYSGAVAADQKVQGPFTVAAMRAWFNQGFFPPDTAGEKVRQ